ncbi:glutamine amidotransferase [Leucobacter albus]|uniref:Glutamine amidotransferase n=1 Tax=Leucobacter albus TaxID=272210 RepID=A0ABW3TPP0_9MICO
MTSQIAEHTPLTNAPIRPRRGVAYLIRHVSFEGPGHLGGVLRELGYEVRIRDAGTDSLHPGDLADGDLLVILGGPISATDTATYPFLHEEKRLIRRWLDSDRPLLGICLGAQLIAEAMGGQVTQLGRPEIGYAPLTLTPEGAQSVLAPLANRSVLHWHGEHVSLPPGARHLARSSRTPVQAFSYGQHVLALQFHLEAEHTAIEHWLVGHAVELRAAGVDPHAIRHQAAHFGPALQTAGRAALRGWLGRLPGAATAGFGNREAAARGGSQAGSLVGPQADPQVAQ